MAGKNLFNSVMLKKPKSNVFDLTHDVKLSLRMGELVPIMITECVPGDRFSISCESLLRFAPLVSPMMHRVDVTMHYFFVPNRLVWPNWEKFITNTKLEETGALPAFPTTQVGWLSPTTFYYNRLMDYMGIPTPDKTGANKQKDTISAMAFAAYQCVYNEYYRDQNLIDTINYKLEDGDNTSMDGLTTLRHRAWEHDYFTSCLPWAQKGDPVTIPVSGIVEFKEDPTAIPRWRNPNTGATSPGGDINSGFTGASNVQDGGSNPPTMIDPDGTLVVDNIESTINDLRTATKLQEWLEKAARSGSRYIEAILAHFGVHSSDKRLQRPEYITGVKSPVVISEVLQTGQTDNTPQGNMAGHAVSVTAGQYGSYFCEEHGYIIGIMSVMPKTAYMQGIPKHFLKTEDPFQYFWPEFAHIGEQEVQNREVYAFDDPATYKDTFGYVPRYAEYKFENNRVAGDFRESLDYWHMARKFSAPPALNQEFIECFPTDRVFAIDDPDNQNLYCQVINKVKAVRPMPVFGTPTF